MSKNITVSSVAFVHEADVNPENRVDAKGMNAAMEAAIRQAELALENEVGAFSSFHLANIKAVLRSMLTTHRTIRKVLGWGSGEPTSTDALALARIPLEGLYAVSLFAESPVWVDTYVRDGWKKQYEQFLLQREETRKLPRFDEFSNQIGPQNIEMAAHILGLDRRHMETIEHDQLGTPLGPGGKQDIPRFPTPGGALTKIAAGTSKRRMLERFYPEYVFLCSFAHGLPEANLFKAMFDKESQYRHLFDERELGETFQRQVAERAYTTSLLSLMQAAVEIVTLYPSNVELRVATLKGWQELSTGHLLGRAIWAIRTAGVLGIV